MLYGGREMWREIIKGEYKGYKVEVNELPIFLARNENPYDIPIDIKREIVERLINTPWNRYPDSKALRLRRAMSEFIGLPMEQFLFGNGSGEIINIIANALLRPKDKVILTFPTFPLYPKIFLQKDLEIIYINLDEEFNIPWKEIENYIEKDIKLIVFCNPNNPTGNLLLNTEDINRFRDFKGFILIDEAYYEFSGITFLPFLKMYPNLLILRTFSKAFSSAGVRLGYIMGNEKVIEYLENYRLPYNLNIFSQIAGEIVIKYWDLLKDRIEFIKRERDYMYKKMKEISNITVYPSFANFIFFTSELKEKIQENMINNGISLRDFSKDVRNALRVTVGNEFENRSFLKCLLEVFKE